MRLARHKPKEIIYYKNRGWISAAPLRGKVCNWINLWIACLHSCVNTKTSHMESSPGTGPVNMWCLQTHCVIFTHRTMLWLRNLTKYIKCKTITTQKLEIFRFNCVMYLSGLTEGLEWKKMHISITTVVISGVPYETSNLSVCYRVKTCEKEINSGRKLKM